MRATVHRLASDRRVVAAVCALGLLALMVYGAGSGYRAAKVSQFEIFTLVYLSLVILTGMSGVISLLAATFLGIGAFTVAATMTQLGWPFLLAVPVAGIVTSAVCIVIGLPVLRLRASAFLVMTLGFVALVEEVVFTNEWCCGGGSTGVPAPRPDFLASDQRYMVLCAVVLVAVYLFTLAWRDSRIGRALITTRDNPRAAEVLGVNVTKAKLAAFAISGFVAGIAGGLFAGLLTSVDNQGGSYSVDRGIEFFGFAMLGGIGSMAGPIIAASARVLSQLVLDESPLADHTGLILLAIAGPGTVLVQLRSPAGIAGIFRRWLRGSAIERAGSDAESAVASDTPESDAARASAVASTDRGSAAWEGWPGGARLHCLGVSCNFGGVRALADVSVSVEPGQVVGLLGTNGAGKSTLINVVSGLAPIASGQVVLEVPDGVDRDGDTTWRAEDLADHLTYERARLGIGRTFQDVRLFPSLTVVDNLLAATHVSQRRGLLANGLLLPPAVREERRARATVDAVMDLVDLRPFAAATAAELSYGTLRLLEVAAMLVLRPRLLLLDEPASGVAEAEARALGPLLRRVVAETGVSMVLVEHDVALVAAVADRIVGMDAGRVLVEGTPEQVLSDELMITAYLGADPRTDTVSGSSSQEARA